MKGEARAGDLQTGTFGGHQPPGLTTIKQGKYFVQEITGAR